MKYLYGDATESPLRFNYLELLRAVVGFCAEMLEVTDGLVEHRREAERLRAEASTELGQLRRVRREMIATIDGCTEEVTAAKASRCIEDLREHILGDLDAACEQVESSLGQALDRLKREGEELRASTPGILEALLLEHDLPEGSQWVDIKAADEHHYEAKLVGFSPAKVAWVLALDIPDDHLFSAPLRMDRLDGQLSVQVPEESGLFRKSIKLKTYKLAKTHLVSLTRRGPNTTLKLRGSLTDHENGFDFVFDESGRAMRGKKITKGEAGESFELQADDAEVLGAIHRRMREAGEQLTSHRRRLESALLDGESLESHASPEALVERLVEQMAPVVHEIARHSRAPDELVLKRVLADDRREEIFVPKDDLRARLEPLAPSSRQLFAPLGLAPEQAPSDDDRSDAASTAPADSAEGPDEGGRSALTPDPEPGPSGSEREALEPEALEPEALEPEALEPKALEPEVLEPEALEPEEGAAAAGVDERQQEALPATTAALELEDEPTSRTELDPRAAPSGAHREPPPRSAAVAAAEEASGRVEDELHEAAGVADDSDAGDGAHEPGPLDDLSMELETVLVDAPASGRKTLEGPPPIGQAPVLLGVPEEGSAALDETRPQPEEVDEQDEGEETAVRELDAGMLETARKASAGDAPSVGDAPSAALPAEEAPSAGDAPSAAPSAGDAPSAAPSAGDAPPAAPPAGDAPPAAPPAGDAPSAALPAEEAPSVEHAPSAGDAPPMKKPPPQKRPPPKPSAPAGSGLPLPRRRGAPPNTPTLRPGHHSTSPRRPPPPPPRRGRPSGTDEQPGED